jgi:zinc protease
MDESSVIVRALTANFPAALHLLADITLHPTFAEAEIARQKTSRLGQLAQARQDPSAVGDQVAARVLYGPRHPYGYADIGTEASIKSTSRDDLVRFWRTAFVPGNAALIVAGKIDSAELRALAEREFGAWPAGKPVVPKLGTPTASQAKLVIVDIPDAPQTQLRVTNFGIPRSTPDYEAITVMNNALGGLFSSRINLNLREAHGYTYGAWSFFDARRLAGPFIAAAGVRTDVTAPAVSEMLKELNGIRTAPLTDKELALAKDAEIRSVPSNFETAGNAANHYGTAYTYGLGLDYYSKLPARLTAVTSAAALEAARKHVLVDGMRVIAVGDRAKIEPKLRALQLGLIEHRDTDGNIIAEEKK